MSAVSGPEPNPYPGPSSHRPDLNSQDTEKYMKWKAIRAREARKKRMLEARNSKQDMGTIAEEARAKQVRYGEGDGRFHMLCIQHNFESLPCEFLLFTNANVNG